MEQLTDKPNNTEYIWEYSFNSTSGQRNWTKSSLANPGFGKGGPQNFFPRFCRRSEAELGEQSKPILAGVQGPP